MFDDTLGYLKDKLAVFIFLLSFILVFSVKNINNLKPFILFGLALGFFIDGWFTLHPHYHHLLWDDFIKKPII